MCMSWPESLVTAGFQCGLLLYFVAGDSVFLFLFQLIEALGVSLSESVALSN